MSSPRDDLGSSRDGGLTARPLVMGRVGAVAAGHYLAAEAGMGMVRSGGNAIDAGVAAGLALNVLLFDRTSFAGVAPIIIYHASSDQVVTLDGLGVWPELTDVAEIIRRKDGVSSGILRTVTPGAADSWLTALGRYGTMSLGEVMSPALELARDGAPIARLVAASLVRQRDEIEGKDPVASQIFFPGGKTPLAGQVLVQADLARTFSELIDVEARARRQGLDRAEAIGVVRDHFYRGPIADRIAEYYQQQGGWLRREDLHRHRVEVAPAVCRSYRGIDVYTCGPWCQGPMMLQFLGILDCLDLEAAGHNTVEYLHLVIEAMDLVFSDRENYYGDPRHIDVPLQGLLSDRYLAERASLIGERASGRMPDPGEPWRYQPGASQRRIEPVDVSQYLAPEGPSKSDTSYVAAVDEQGNVFSATPSDPVFWTPMVPGVGLSCSGRGTQSRTDPGHPSRIAPGTRPRLTPNPALAMMGGRPLLAIGCPGGDAQTQGMLQVLLNMIHFGMNPQEAIEAPRVISRNHPNSFSPHTYYPGRVEVEADLDTEVTARLSDLGHDVKTVRRWAPSSSSVSVVVKNPTDGTLLAGSDPRNEGAAAAW